jgi:nitrite reductase/ring-hydroxylating ferredoxin subunit
MKYLRHIEEGTLEEYNLTCPWHDGVFDVRDTTVSDQTPWAAFYILLNKDRRDNRQCT